MDILVVLSRNARKYWFERHFSQEQLAERTGLHRTYISAVAHGKCSIVLENIQHIADALQTNTYSLFMDN